MNGEETLFNEMRLHLLIPYGIGTLLLLSVCLSHSFMQNYDAEFKLRPSLTICGSRLPTTHSVRLSIGIQFESPGMRQIL